MRAQRSTEEIKKLLAEQERSGKTVREFCTERGITVEVFYGYRSRMKMGTAESQFSPVLSGSKITLELSSGKSITFARELLPQILSGLSQ